MQKDKATDRRYLFPSNATLTLLILVAVAERLVDKERLTNNVMIVVFEPTVQPFGSHVLQEEITPRGGLVGSIFSRRYRLGVGHSFYTRSRRMFSPDDVNAFG